jgi:3-deoxy-D-manno-octulosonate 8-phosphate phosphatase (KDO 8-P phosphatase)
MNVLEAFNKISTFIFDVDGVLTDGTVLVLDGGLQARRMNIKDGFALQMAVKNKYRVLIVSGGNSPQVVTRLENLGITDVHMMVNRKDLLIREYMEKNNLLREETLYMGDDLPDIPAMEIVGLATCPSDAATEVKELAQYISPFSGGNACVREVIEKVLRLHDRWHFQPDISSR